MIFFSPPQSRREWSGRETGHGRKSREGIRFGSKRPKIVAAFCCRLNALNQLFGKGKAEADFALKLEQSY